MAHRINFNEKRKTYSFASARQIAWHSLGKVYDVDKMTAEDCIIGANLDFEVEKAPLYSPLHIIQNMEEARICSNVLKIKDEKDTWQFQQTKRIATHFATYRTDTKDVFGVVGKGYTIVQNRDAFAFFDAIVGEGKAIYETAGCLHNGEVIFISAKLPDYIKVSNNDAIGKYLLLTSSHDGSGAIKAFFTPVRVVCNNTLTAAIRGAKDFVSIRHTASVHDRLKEAHKVLGIVVKRTDDLAECLPYMVKCKITDLELRNYIDILFPAQQAEDGTMWNGNMISTKALNVRTALLKYYEEGPGQAEIRGTVYGAYNMVTGYYSNVLNRGDEDRMDYVIGTSRGKLNLALDQALELCK